MVVKIINGMLIHEPPYTQAEEDEFYRRIGGGPVTLARPAGERKEQTSPAPRHPSPAKPARPELENGQPRPKADIEAPPLDVRFTPNSGHRNRPVYHLRRSNSGSLATFAVAAKIVVPTSAIPSLIATLRAGVQDEDEALGVCRLVQ